MLSDATISDHTLEKDQYIVHIHVPIERRTEVRYRIVKFPIGLGIGKAGYTELVTPERYYVQNSTHYATSILKESLGLAIMRKEVYSCVSGIFEGRPEVVHQLCEFRISPIRPPKVYFSIGNNWHILANFESDNILTCATESRVLNLDVVTKIRIPCDCHVASENYTLINNDPTCDTFSNTMEIERSLNWPLYAAMTDKIGTNISTADWSEYHAQLLKVDSDLASSLSSSTCLLYTSPSPRDKRQSRMPSSA